MSTAKLYLSALADIGIILLAVLADFELHVRLITGVAGIVLAILTSIKFYHDIRQKRLDVRKKRIELQRAEEDFRRYMEKKYN